MKLYSTLASWWPLVSSVAEYAEEAEQSWRIMSQHATRPIETMLELGCGGGNNAFHLKTRCRMTLTDLSPHMLAVSRQLNAECQHIEGDMRSLRLGREFDAVFTHDAIMHMCTEDALREGDGPPRVEHDRLTLGLFPEATWLRLLGEVGFASATVETCRFSGGEQVSCFVGVRVA